MAPRKRIWGLNDIGQNNVENLLNHNNINDTNTRKPNSNDGGGVNTNPLESAYCQPTSSSAANNNPPQKQNIKLCHIPNLNLNDRCSSTLHQILDEFYPIIQRRNFNVLSISEMCCCGDGLDYDHHNHKSNNKRRKLRKQSSNVWGYNCTKFMGGRGNKKSHTIHLRLRNPHSHNQLLDWEDVAGTMAHELSHCIHQNHSSAFYKLMEEILEEHAMLQMQKLSTSNGGMYFENNNNPTKAAITGVIDDHSIPTSGGHRLGGDVVNGTNRGQSRLIRDNNNSSSAPTSSSGDGYRLGGSSSSTKFTNPNTLRQKMAQAAMARAAETRGRLLDRTRRMMERAKEPCVIEILDDDDDDDGIDKKDPRAPTRQQQQHDRKPQAKRKTSRAVGEPNRTKVKTELIDLTTPNTTLTKNMASFRQTKSINAVDGATDEILIDDRKEVAAVEKIHPSSTWVCSLCTYRNRPLALVCDVCLSQR